MEHKRVWLNIDQVKKEDSEVKIEKDEFKVLERMARTYLEDTVMVQPYTFLTNKNNRKQRFILADNQNHYLDFDMYEIVAGSKIKLFTIFSSQFKSYWPTISDLNNYGLNCYNREGKIGITFDWLKNDEEGIEKDSEIEKATELLKFMRS